MKRVKLIVGASLLFAAGTAAAQGDPDPAAPPPDASAGGGAAVTTPEVGVTAGAWSTAVIDQPMTLHAGKLAVYGNLDILRVSVPPVMGVGGGTVTSEGLDLGVGYGVNDKITVGATYAFSLHEFEIKGPLTLFGAATLFDKDKLTVGASANLTISLGDTTTETIQAGLGVRYKVTPKFAVYTGGAGPGLLSSALGVVTEVPRAGSPLGQHLSIGLNSDAPITFDIPVGVGLQLAPQAFLYANTAIAHIKIANAENAFVFADYIPLNVGLRYAVDQHLEVGAYLTLPDLKEAQFDLMVFGVGARYYN